MARRGEITISDILQPSFDAKLHRVQIDEITERFYHVIDSKKGHIVVITGRENTGKTVFASQCISALSHRKERPLLLVGGFELSNSSGFVGRLLPDHAIDLPTILTGLGQVLSSAAAAAVATAPAPGAAQLGVSLAAFTGQAAQTVGFAAGVHPEDKRPHPGGLDSPITPEDLLYVVRRLCASGRPVVLCIDDLQLAHPPLHWCRLFLRTLMEPLLAQYPVLLIVIAETNSSINKPVSTAMPPAEYFQTLLELCQVGLANEIRLHPLTLASLKAWLGDMDDSLASDLLACAGSTPGWVARLIDEWRSNGIAIYDPQALRWRYTTNGRDSAKADVEDFIRVAVWHLAGGSVDVFTRINHILRTATLEGTDFTADALARVLGDDREELVDWIDEHLTVHAAGANAPLEEAGFIEIPDRDSQGGLRYLCKYRFRSKLLWSALDATAHRKEWEDLPQTPVLAAAYADALVKTYSRDVWRVSRRIAWLCKLAGKEESSQFYEQLWDLRGSAKLYLSVLQNELEAVAKAKESQQSWDILRAISAARRIIGVCHVLEGTCEQGEDFTGFQVAFMLANKVAELAADARPLTTSLMAESLAALGRLSFTRGQVANAVIYSKYAADAYGLLDAHEPQAYALLLTAGALAWCIVYLAAENIDLFDKGIWLSGYPELEVPDDLWFLDASRSRRPNITEVRSVAQEILSQARSIISHVVPEKRRELCGEYLQSSARLKYACDDIDTACDLLRRSIAILPVHSQKRTESCLLLGQYLVKQKKYSEAEAPTREALSGCIRDRRVVRTTAPLWYLAIILMNTQRETEVIEVLGYLLNLCAQVNQVVIASMGWDELGILLSRQGNAESDVLECLAISIAAGANVSKSGERSFDDYASTLGLGKRKRAELLASAEQIWSDDRGVGVLQRILGVTSSGTEAFLAAQGMRRNSYVSETAVTDPLLAVMDIDL